MTLAMYHPGISEKTVTQIILCSVVQMKNSGLERFVPNSISHSRCSNICSQFIEEIHMASKHEKMLTIEYSTQGNTN